MLQEYIITQWETAYITAEFIWHSFVTGENTQQAKKQQQALKNWLDSMRAKGYVYNGILDEYVIIKL